MHFYARAQETLERRSHVQVSSRRGAVAGRPRGRTPIRGRRPDRAIDPADSAARRADVADAARGRLRSERASAPPAQNFYTISIVSGYKPRAALPAPEDAELALVLALAPAGCCARHHRSHRWPRSTSGSWC